jgi:hypothetical protein
MKSRPWNPARVLCRPRSVLNNFPDVVSVSIPVYEQEPGRNVTLKFGETLDNIAGSEMAAGQALN